MQGNAPSGWRGHGAEGEEDAMEMDVWYDVLVREAAEAERLEELLAQAEEEDADGLDDEVEVERVHVEP